MIDTAPILELTARDRLQHRLSAALSPDAMLLARRISLQLLLATSHSPVAYRRVRILALLCKDALNQSRSEPARTLHWRRFIRALAPFARETESLWLRRLVAENLDLAA